MPDWKKNIRTFKPARIVEPVEYHPFGFTLNEPNHEKHFKINKEFVMAKKRDPRSEAAQKEAVRLLKRNTVNECAAYPYFVEEPGSTEVQILRGDTEEVIAIFDLRDCYRKREPLKGITKKFRKAIQPKRKKGKK